MSGDYPHIIGEDQYLGSQFLDQISAMDDFGDPFSCLWFPGLSSYSDFPPEPLDDILAITSAPLTPLSSPPQLGSPPFEFEFEQFVNHESDPAEDTPFFYTINTPPQTISPHDLTPTTPRSPDSNSSPTDTSPTTPGSPSIDGSRASANPTTPGSPAPENYEPVQKPAGDWGCAFPRCLKRYRRRCDVNKHCKTHTKPFACRSCGQKSSSKRDMQRHELSHRSQHPRCPYPSCTSTTSRKDNMRDHIKRKHRDMDPRDPRIDALYSKPPRTQK